MQNLHSCHPWQLVAAVKPIPFALQIWAVPEEAPGCAAKALPAWSWHRVYRGVFTASCQASYRTLNKAYSSRTLFITKSLVKLSMVRQACCERLNLIASAFRPRNVCVF
ncbi:hypothetical protein EQU24_15735 [Methylotuvimicrobium buryatense]|uniref:Uncharacterized protein n=1 Tax=Methylotuvimicrobium buryatense TaxID=95641 RepID=A0A4P9USL6_METBY|nr:hypothetical protein EQU24_15735 [Methylotuvimicrobium buryatense]